MTHHDRVRNIGEQIVQQSKEDASSCNPGIVGDLQPQLEDEYQQCKHEPGAVPQDFRRGRTHPSCVTLLAGRQAVVLALCWTTLDLTVSVNRVVFRARTPRP